MCMLFLVPLDKPSPQQLYNFWPFLFHPPWSFHMMDNKFDKNPSVWCLLSYSVFCLCGLFSFMAFPSDLISYFIEHFLLLSFPNMPGTLWIVTTFWRNIKVLDCVISRRTYKLPTLPFDGRQCTDFLNFFEYVP